MTERFSKPVKFAGYQFEGFQGGEDPATVSRLAHETAAALVARVRAERDPEVVERLVTFTDEHGIDAIAELWSRATAHSLPGALWRIYLLRAMIRSDAAGIALYYQRGIAVARTIDPVIAGAPDPAGPDEVLALADEILRGIFTGDLAIALERAAAFARVEAAGCASLADDADAAEPGRATDLTTRASRLSTIAADLSASSKLWRSGGLD
ncbi:DNA-directed RNA polymerase subunit beta [Naasia sp. SYSU D00057]|uniref:DNA-directed RNA polymerase subunit beta n=1 Tax=Naasia sp. SYSU D00057 TaxID=2817380 RepID=UPI001B30F25C|nr:DNA-directed RNA polymerase subunit beta [Naasia sp. SYSU D00057]